jgi:hypothetical protein
LTILKQDGKDSIALQKSRHCFGNVIEASPETQDVYVYRARTNTLLGDDELMIKYYQQYIDIVTKVLKKWLKLQ